MFVFFDAGDGELEADRLPDLKINGINKSSKVNVIDIVNVVKAHISTYP